jgi:hypothetical protein
MVGAGRESHLAFQVCRLPSRRGPGVVISTDLALTSGLIAIGTAVHDKLLGLDPSDGAEKLAE